MHIHTHLLPHSYTLLRYTKSQIIETTLRLLLNINNVFILFSSWMCTPCKNASVSLVDYVRCYCAPKTQQCMQWLHQSRHKSSVFRASYTGWNWAFLKNYYTEEEPQWVHSVCWPWPLALQVEQTKTYINALGPSVFVMGSTCGWEDEELHGVEKEIDEMLWEKRCCWTQYLKKTQHIVSGQRKADEQNNRMSAAAEGRIV